MLVAGSHCKHAAVLSVPPLLFMPCVRGGHGAAAQAGASAPCAILPGRIRKHVCWGRRWGAAPASGAAYIWAGRHAVACAAKVPDDGAWRLARIVLVPARLDGVWRGRPLAPGQGLLGALCMRRRRQRRWVGIAGHAQVPAFGQARHSPLSAEATPAGRSSFRRCLVSYAGCSEQPSVLMVVAPRRRTSEWGCLTGCDRSRWGRSMRKQAVGTVQVGNPLLTGTARDVR